MNARSTLRGLRHALCLALAVLLVGVSLPSTAFAQPENIPRFIGEQVIASWRAYPPTVDQFYRYELKNAMVRGDNYDFVRQIQAQQAERGRQPLSVSLQLLVENRVISRRTRCSSWPWAMPRMLIRRAQRRSRCAPPNRSRWRCWGPR